MGCRNVAVSRTPTILADVSHLTAKLWAQSLELADVPLVECEKKVLEPGMRRTIQ